MLGKNTVAKEGILMHTYDEGLHIQPLYGEKRDHLFVKDKPATGISEQPVLVRTAKTAPPAKRTTLPVLLMGFDHATTLEIGTALHAYYSSRGIRPLIEYRGTLADTREALKRKSYELLIAEPGNGDHDGYTAAWVAPGIATKYGTRCPHTILYGSVIDARRASDAKDTAATPQGLERALTLYEQTRYGETPSGNRIIAEPQPQEEPEETPEEAL